MLIKFQQLNFLEELRNKGKFYCNTREFFRDLELKEQKKGKGDKFEQTHSIENTKSTRIEITNEDGSYKDENFYQGRIITYDIINLGQIYCFTKIDSYSELKHLDDRILSWSDYFLIINNSELLINRISSKLKQLNIDNEIRKIEYKNLQTKSIIKMDPFIKNIDFAYQQEFRIFLNTNGNKPFEFEIGSIEDISEIIQIKEIKNFI